MSSDVVTAMHSCIVIASREVAINVRNRMMQNMQNPDSSLCSNISALRDARFYKPK